MAPLWHDSTLCPHSPRTPLADMKKAAAALAGLAATAAGQIVVKNTTAGLVESVSVTSTTMTFIVPFAQPPVGDLRFKAPQPHQPWEGVYVSPYTTAPAW